MNKKQDFIPTPKSMNLSGVWSPEGKALRAENRNWAYPTKKQRNAPPKKWESKLAEYTRQSFAQRNHIYNKYNDKTK